MKPHKIGGLLRDCKVVYAWLWFNDESGIFIQISKTEAREYINGAKEDGVEEVMAFVKGDELFLGDDDETAAEDAGEGAEEGSEEEEEEEEEEDLGEEEEEDGEEEADEEEEAPPAKIAVGAKPSAAASPKKGKRA
jgi:hypothetical protein